jgi:hypothetical protein
MTLAEIIEQLESCNYECEAGPLENNVAWQELKKVAYLYDLPDEMTEDELDEFLVKHGVIDKLIAGLPIGTNKVDE